MNEILSFVRSAVQTDQDKREQVRDCWWVECDLVGMFPNTLWAEVIAALNWARDQVKGTITHRTGIWFYLSKGGRQKLDNMKVDARDSFYRFTFEDVLHYMTWDLNFNTCFLAVSFVFTLATGIAIGSSCSAQVASIVLIFENVPRLYPLSWSTHFG